jgi:hypothetical protein
MAGENAIAKAGREPLDLRFNFVRHVDIAVKWNVTIGPQRVLTAWRARCIEQTLLGDQHEWPLWNLSQRNLTFRRRNLVNTAAEMNCTRATARFSFPRNW